MKQRYDGLGIAMLGLVVFLLTGLAVTGFIRAPTPSDDHSVQQSLAWASWAMVVVSVTAGMIGALSLYLIYHTLLAAQRSAIAAELTVAETRAIGRAQTRAYLSIESAKFAYDGIVSEFEVCYRNAGQSPALDLKIVLTTFCKSTDFSPDLGHMESAEQENWPDLVSGGAACRTVFMIGFDPRERVEALESDSWSLTCNFELALEYFDVFDEQHVAKASFSARFGSVAELGTKREFAHPL